MIDEAEREVVAEAIAHVLIELLGAQAATKPTIMAITQATKPTAPAIVKANTRVNTQGSAEELGR